MPATYGSYERGLALSVEGFCSDGEPCPTCGGTGIWYGHLGDETECRTCNGTGTVSPERAAEDAADDRDDLLTELRADREAGR